LNRKPKSLGSAPFSPCCQSGRSTSWTGKQFPDEKSPYRFEVYQIII